MAIHSPSVIPTRFEPVSRPAPPEDQERAEDVYDIPLGSIVHDAETGSRWVFFGWTSNTAGRQPNFIEETMPDRPSYQPRYDYHAAFAKTLERKFPDLARFRRALMPETAS